MTRNCSPSQRRGPTSQRAAPANAPAGDRGQSHPSQPAASASCAITIHRCHLAFVTSFLSGAGPIVPSSSPDPVTQETRRRAQGPSPGTDPMDRRAGVSTIVGGSRQSALAPPAMPHQPPAARRSAKGRRIHGPDLAEELSPGVPHEVDPESYRSVAHLLEESLRRHADHPFSVCMEQWMDYAELDRLSTRLGAWLQAQGLPQGARVAIMLPNVPQFAVAMAAVLRAGYTCVNVNPLYTPRELEHQLRDSGAGAIVILENFARTFSEVVERTAVKHVVLTAFGDLLGPVRGRWLTFAVRHLARMVPAFDLPPVGRPPRDDAARGPGRGRAAHARTQHRQARFRRVPAVHGRHHGAVEGRGAHAPQHRCGHPPGGGLVHAGARPHRRRAPGQQHRGATALPYLRAHAVPAGHPPGLAPHADPEPAGHTQARGGAEEASLPPAARGEHALQRAAAERGVPHARFLAPVRVAGGRHGRFERAPRGNGRR